MLGALNWTVRWYRPQGPASVKTVARDLMDFLIGGLTAAGTTPAADPAGSQGGRT